MTAHHKPRFGGPAKPRQTRVFSPDFQLRRPSRHRRPGRATLLDGNLAEPRADFRNLHSDVTLNAHDETHVASKGSK
jgi:hypothetical protein